MSDEQTFLFADLAGFTALTEAMGDEPAADLAGEFFAAVRELLPSHGAEEIKAIGDELMIRSDAAADAIRLALCLVNDLGGTHGFPLIRVGIHSGPAVERDGDWFGATVNVAARVSALAGGGEVLLTEQVRTAAGELEDVELTKHGESELKNVREAITVYAAWSAGEHASDGLPIDPVCRMAVDPDRAAGTLRHAGTEFHFCSLECARAFTADPDSYAVQTR
jgi:adenylate cyclase